MIIAIIYLRLVVSVNEQFLKKIYDLSVESFNLDEIPVGAIVVKNGEIVGVGINSRKREKSVIGHAEINAINDACRFIGDWRLDECEMYVTLLPCMMCAGAIYESRIKKVYYLCDRTNVCYDTGKYINVEKIDNTEYEDKYLKMFRLFFENKRN